MPKQKKLFSVKNNDKNIDMNVDEGKITLDLFTCDVSLEDRNVKKIICDYFSISTFNVDMYYFTRG